MDPLLLDQEQEPEIPDLILPRCEPFEIAIHECRVFDRHGRLKRVIPAPTLRQVMKNPLGAGFPEGYFKVTYLPTSI